MDGFLVNDIARHIGKTVTIFTTSGGLSGAGFTGVLLSVDQCVVRLLTDMGAPPACPIGSSCNSCMTPFGMANGYGGYGGYGGGYGSGGYGYGGCYGYGYGGYGNNCGCDNFCNDGCRNPLGSVAVIPIQTIAAFTHNAI